MIDPSLRAKNLLLAGMTGSGKTTFAIRLMINSPAAAAHFIFDDEDRVWPRLGVRPCYTERECELALPSRSIVFNPSRSFPFQEGDRDLNASKRRAFRWWCHWIFRTCARGPGLKDVYLPEIWRFCTPESIPVEFAQLLQQGRELNTRVIVDTQRPELTNPSITGQCTELVCFKLLASGQPDCPVKTVVKLGADGNLVQQMPLGSFIGYNRLEVPFTTLRGRLF